MSTGRSSLTHRSQALLLARVDYGDADLVVTLFTRTLGRVSALARGARRSKRRFAGSLEPLHTLHVTVDERPHGELLLLREAAIDVPRTKLAGDLDGIQAAGKALGWLRKAAPPRTLEPAAWEATVHFLDLLDRAPERQTERLLELGLRLLGAFGWGLDLARCVRCGKPCPTTRTALVSPERGGLICRGCGGGPLRLSGPLRHALGLAALGHDDVVPTDELSLALEVVERALVAHMGFE